MNKKLITAPVVALILISSIATLTATTTVTKVHASRNLCGIFTLITCSPLQQDCNMDPMSSACSQIGSQHQTLQCDQSQNQNQTLPCLLLGPTSSPNAYALTLPERYNSGFSDGAQQATTDFQNGNSFNTVCDPAGAYISDGKHTSIFCDGWVKGYTATWNNLVQHPLPQMKDILNMTDKCPMLVACR